MDRRFVIDDVAVNRGFKDFGFRGGAVVIQHGAKRLHVLEFGRQSRANYVVTVGHALDAIARQVRVRLVRTCMSRDGGRMIVK